MTTPPQPAFQFPQHAAPAAPAGQFPAPATGQLNAMLDAQMPPVPAQPTPADYGTAAYKLLNSQPFGPNDSPAVMMAAQWLYANPTRAQEMLAHYAPSAPPVQTLPTTGGPGQPLYVHPGAPTIASTSPPGWNPQPGQPNMLHAAPGGLIPPDAPPANLALTTPEEKKKRASKTAATAEMGTAQIVLLGRIADSAEELAKAFDRIAAALEKR